LREGAEVVLVFGPNRLEMVDWTLDQLVSWVEGWEPSEPAWNTLIADFGRKSLSPVQSHDPSDDAAEWKNTCDAFEARVTAKRRRGPSRE